MLRLCLSVLLYSVHTNAKPQGDAGDVQCKSFDEFGYYCVPYYQCDENNKIITNGIGLLDPRSTDTCEEPDHNVAITSKCSKLLEVCCRHPAAKLPPRCSTTEFPSCEDDIFGDCGSPVEPAPTPITPVDPCGIDGDIFDTCISPPTPSQCGKRNNNIVSSKLGESAVKNAQFGEWPHVCAMLKKEFIGESTEPLLVYQCGASLLADNVVLTAGHCVNDTESLEGRLLVRCGEWDTQDVMAVEETLAYQERDVMTVKKHPEFNVDNHHNNFALLFLQEKFDLADHISPVCLPKPGSTVPEQNCVSHGWGKDKFGAEGSYATVLKEVVVPIVGNKECEKLLRENTRLGEYFELDDSFICAGGKKGVDTCKGDGGSALVCKNQGQPWYQAGIVSWGIGCGENSTPAVYANVAEAACWIDAEVKCFLDKEESIFGFTKSDCPDSANCL